jgi:hypothetical protein
LSPAVPWGAAELVPAAKAPKLGAALAPVPGDAVLAATPFSAVALGCSGGWAPKTSGVTEGAGG